jgi:carboxypeptidase family protein/TonB-dependent receptor-like protein
MKRTFFVLIAATLLVASISVDLWAQATAQISGTVKDQSGAVLPGVEITATQTDTGATRMAITNETGSYILSNLPIGPYKLEAALPGFRTFVQTGIILQVNGSPAINPTLEVGQVTEQVEVSANAALVETRNAGVGQVVENARILELPLNGRNVNELISLSGAVTPAAAQGSGRNPFLPDTGVSVAGGSSIGLNYTLDGANHNNSFENTFLSMPFPDAMQEFKVETSATAVQNGVRPSGSVSLVTKSGTNALHGDLFEFVRNGKFNARNAFATKRDTIKRNQFGGTAGGAIMKNKLFFFGGYQGTTVRQDPADTVTFVPTAAMLAGDFTAFAAPSCNAGRTTTLRAPFVNNQINPTLLSRAAVNLSKLLPQTTDPCGRVVYGNQTRTNLHMFVGRMDYQLSDKNSVFGRYLADSNVSPPAYTLNHNILSPENGIDGLTQAFTIGDTYLWGANIVNSVRLSANRWVGGRTGVDYAGWPELGVKMFSYQPKHLAAQPASAFSISNGGVGAAKMALFGGNEDLSIVHQNHQFTVGTQLAWWWINSYSDFYSYGRATFSGQVTGLPLADFLTGNVGAWTQGTPAPTLKRDRYAGAYAGDTWKLNSKWTFNYGVRWEPFLASINRDGSTIHYDHDAFVKGIKSDKLLAAPPGLFFAGDPGVPGNSMMKNRWWNFSPRVGLAWDVNGDGRTSVRASVGTFYDYPSSFFQVGLSNAPPTSQRQVINGVNLDNPWANYPGGEPFPTAFGKDWDRNTPWPLNAVVTAVDYDTKNSMITQWNLSMQKQLGSDWLVSTSYLGSQSAHLWALQQLNPAVYIPGQCAAGQFGLTAPGACSTTANTNQRRVLYLENPNTGKFFGTVNRIDSGATGSYHGLVLSLQRRAAKGVTIGSNYTLSHCINDNVLGNTGNSGNADAGYLNSQDRNHDRGNCDADRRHVFSLSAVAQTPQFSNSTLRLLGSGWRVSPIFKVLSGGFMTITTSSDVALTAIASQRVNQLQGGVYGDKTIGNYLNPRAFALPAAGTLGSAGRNSVLGPGSWQFDMGLSRSFKMREAQRIEFRAEAFNLTNSFIKNSPTTNLNSGNFGQITSAKDPRIMQFALKYFF